MLAVLCIASASTLATGAWTAAAGPARTATSSTAADKVTITVDAVTPVTPARSQKKQALTVTLTVDNPTSTNLKDLTIRAERGDPITTQKALTKATTEGASAEYAHIVDVTTDKPVTITSLPAATSTRVTFATTTDIPRDAGICLCHDAVYPLLFSVRTTSTGGADEVLASTSTFLPVSVTAVPKVGVGWLWPLMDRPHRLLSDTVFEDDDLAAEVASGGRLDRALSVVETLNGAVPLTLVVDPETIDELAVMAAGSYRVRSEKTSVPGTGSEVAATWLERLHQVLVSQPSTQVEQTPYADPDVQSLTDSGLGYAATSPTQMADRVARALDGKTIGTDLAWPSSTRLSSATLATLAAHGADEVVLDAAGVNTGVATTDAQPGAMRIKTGSSTISGLLTTSRLTGLVSSAVSAGGGGEAALPRLLSELTVRVTENRDDAQVALLTPPKYVDPDVASAVETIRSSTTSTYTSPASLDQLTSAAVLPRTVGTLRSPGSTPDGLSGDLLDADDDVSNATGILTSLLIPEDATPAERTSTAAGKFLLTLPVARQRLVSSAWRKGNGTNTTTAKAYAHQVRGVLATFEHGVHIIAPSNSTYTLTSGKSDLPITVTNQLDYPVYVTVSVSAVGGLPGLKVSDGGTRAIAAGTNVIVRLPTTIDRSGRLEVEASLTTPNGATLGRSVQLTLRNTSLGTVGVVIMVVAGALLLAALARRWYRSARRPRTRPPVTPLGGDAS